MLGHVGPRWGRCNVEDLVATDTEDLRVPHALGRWVIVSSGLSTRPSVAPGAPGCLPCGLPERVREERFAAGFFTNGESDDGGLPLLEESRPSWARSVATMPSSS